MSAFTQLGFATLTVPDESLLRELWVSLASLLRSYTAAHGLNRAEQAVVELGEQQITVRVDQRWLMLRRSGPVVSWSRETGVGGVVQFTVEGRLLATGGGTHATSHAITQAANQAASHDVTENGAEDEMDLRAEAWARALMLEVAG